MLGSTNNFGGGINKAGVLMMQNHRKGVVIILKTMVVGFCHGYIVCQEKWQS